MVHRWRLLGSFARCMSGLCVYLYGKTFTRCIKNAEIITILNFLCIFFARRGLLLAKLQYHHFLLHFIIKVGAEHTDIYQYLRTSFQGISQINKTPLTLCVQNSLIYRAWKVGSKLYWIGFMLYIYILLYHHGNSKQWKVTYLSFQNWLIVELHYGN